MPSVYTKKLPEIEYRIARRIKPNGECREWTGSMSRKDKLTGIANRPVIGFRGKQLLVYRLVWELAHGSIPNGLNICHACDNPTCIRTSHLYLGTQSRNIQDAVAKQRWNCPRLERHNMAKLNNQQVAEIRASYAVGGIQQKAIAHDYGVSSATISLIVNRKTWDL